MLQTIGAVLALPAIAAPAWAQLDRGTAQRDYAELGRIAATCRAADRTTGPPHVIREDVEVRRLASRMLRVPEATCPGIARSAYARLRAWVGQVERPDADTDLLALLHQAASGKMAVPADPALATQIARTLWLFEHRQPPLPWTEAERWAFLLQPDTIALLKARAARSSAETRARALLGEALLRRDGPAYDPVEAVTMLESAARSAADKRRVAMMLTDGQLVPVDYRRAARMWWTDVKYRHLAEPARTDLLRIGRLAADAARTPEQRAEAIRILAMAALGTPAYSGEHEAMLARLGPIPDVPLAPADAERIAAAVAGEIGIWGISAPEPDQPQHRPLRLRGLVGPDGEIVLTQVLESSGSAVHDLAAQFVWAENGHKANLSATANGRFVWTMLPPISPRYAIQPR